MLKEDLFEAVIGLPANLFYGAAIPATVIILSKHKAQDRRGKVLIVDASREYREGKAQNYLRDEDFEKITGTFHAGKDVEKYARLVPLAEIEKAGWGLNISRFVESSQDEAEIDLPASLATLRALEASRQEAEARMIALLRGLGYGV